MSRHLLKIPAFPRPADLTPSASQIGMDPSASAKPSSLAHRPTADPNASSIRTVNLHRRASTTDAAIPVQNPAEPTPSVVS